MLKRIALATAAVLSMTFSAMAWDVAAMNRQVDQTNFLLNDNCSATLIDRERGLLLTAHHCVSSQYKTVKREVINDKGELETKEFRVTEPGTVSRLLFNGPNEVSRTTYTFKIERSDKDLDLALVSLLTTVPSDLTAAGEPAYAVGNPMGVLYASVSPGFIASVNRNYRMIGVDNEHGLIQATTPIGGGNSGGALYNDAGEIIGVVVRGYQNISPVALAVPLADIRGFLKEAASPCPT